MMKIPSQLHRVLIAIDDSSYSEIAANYGFQLSRQLGAEVGLLHVNPIPITVPYHADPLANEPSVVMPELIQAEENASNELLKRISAAYDGDCTVSWFSKLGDPVDEILVTAKEWNADLIVLGTHGRTGLSHFFNGSVAEKVVRSSSCPVLIIPNKDENKDE